MVLGFMWYLEKFVFELSLLRSNAFNLTRQKSLFAGGFLRSTVGRNILGYWYLEKAS